MTKENLLKPRFKVIASYPKSIYAVGDIIYLPDPNWMYADETYCKEDFFEDYPAIFRKLEWWEERDMKDMPEYVSYNYSIITIEQLYFNENGFFWQDVLVATKEEYDAYMKTLK